MPGVGLLIQPQELPGAGLTPRTEGAKVIWFVGHLVDFRLISLFEKSTKGRGDLRDPVRPDVTITRCLS